MDPSSTDQVTVKANGVVESISRPPIWQASSWPPPQQCSNVLDNLPADPFITEPATVPTVNRATAMDYEPHNSHDESPASQITSEGTPATRKDILLQSRSQSMPEAEKQTASAMPSKSARARQGLQLPSFRSLGIANPHADSLLTPPDEAGVDPLLGSDLDQSTPMSGQYGIKPAELSPADSPPLESDQRQPQATPTSFSKADRPPHITFSSPAEHVVPGEKAPSTSSSSASESVGGPGWYDKTVETIVSLIQPTEPVNNVLNVLCHSQPCPLPTELEDKPSVYDPIINALQATIGHGPVQAIEVTHAMPSKLNMQRIPISPGNTPAAMPDVVDYFAMNVFSKAVVAYDHETRINTSLPSSPMPIVAPSTVTVSILERYIPPASAAEYKNILRPEGPSALVDRLVEISPKGGCLIFIYPTLQGASTFRTKYLGPLLDPLLRSMVVYHNMSADLGLNVGRLEAREYMLSFENMEAEIRRLLRTMNSPSLIPSTSNAKYQLKFARSHTVHLERRAWQDWWLYQENGRIRRAVMDYWKRGNRIPVGLTEGTIAREILDGLKERHYERDQEPQDGVEVGVFCIQRSA